MSDYVHTVTLREYPPLKKTLSPELWTAIGQLMQVAALLYPFSQRRLDGNELNALDRAEVKDIIRQIETLIKPLKNSML